MVSFANPRLFGQRTQIALTLDQYAGTETEIDIKQAPILFNCGSGSDRTVTTQYAGTDTEIDTKGAPSQFRRKREADSMPAASYVGTSTEIDGKTAPSLFHRKSGADFATAAQFSGSEAEMDPKPPVILFRHKRAASRATARNYAGTDTEVDQKGSDRRLKREIRRIGVSPSGLAIYSFRYVWGGPTYVGVMAQDLLATRPDAVIETDSGYLMVDYGLIDVKMTSLDAYNALRRPPEDGDGFSAPALFARRRETDPATVAQYAGSDTEMDVKISDRRLKREIRRIGVSSSGLAIYSFRYVWGGPMYVGVMAQDLLATRPDAVVLTDSGYYMVDYGKIDVKMASLGNAPVRAEADAKPFAPVVAAQYVGTNTEIDVKHI
jgi:hypothetical protein